MLCMYKKHVLSCGLSSPWTLCSFMQELTSTGLEIHLYISNHQNSSALSLARIVIGGKPERAPKT